MKGQRQSGCERAWGGLTEGGRSPTDGSPPFDQWRKIFADQAMTLAAIDRLVHHATILEMNVESYRRNAALKRKRGPGD